MFLGPALCGGGSGSERPAACPRWRGGAELPLPTPRGPPSSGRWAAGAGAGEHPSQLGAWRPHGSSDCSWARADGSGPRVTATSRFPSPDVKCKELTFTRQALCEHSGGPAHCILTVPEVQGPSLSSPYGAGRGRRGGFRPAGTHQLQSGARGRTQVFRLLPPQHSVLQRRRPKLREQ